MITRIVRKVRARITVSSSAPSGRTGDGQGRGHGHPTQNGPSAPWPVVSVPIGGPVIGRPEVSMTTFWPRDRDDAAVEAARRRAAALLADPVVLRAVAGALEPLRLLAPRHPAAEVHALLVQRDHPLLHPREHRRVLRDLLGLRDVGLRVRLRGRSGPRARRTAAFLLAQNAWMSASGDAGVDLAAEAAGGLGVQEADRRGAERTEADRHRDEDAPVEELPAADAELFLVDRRPLGRRRWCRGSPVPRRRSRSPCGSRRPARVRSSDSSSASPRRGRERLVPVRGSRR